MTDTIYSSQTPATDELDFLTHHLGSQFTVAANANVTGGRAWVPAAGRPPVFWWQLWRVSDMAKLAEVNLNDAGFGTPTAGTWMSLTSANFTTPGDVAIVTTESYVVNVFSDDGHFVYTDPGSFPIGNGIVSASTGRFKTGGVQNDFPNNTFAAYYFADVNVETPAVRPTIVAPVTAVHRAGSW